MWGRWNRGVNLNLGPITLLSDFPHEVGHITEPQLFICLFAFAFADCHSIECICFSAAAMSQSLCWIHFPLVSEARAHTTTTSYTIHTYTYTLFCLPKMTNRRCARTSLLPMRNKDVLGPASPHWVIEQRRIALSWLYDLYNWYLRKTFEVWSWSLELMFDVNFCSWYLMLALNLMCEVDIWI